MAPPPESPPRMPGPPVTASWPGTGAFEAVPQRWWQAVGCCRQEESRERGPCLSLVAGSVVGTAAASMAPEFPLLFELLTLACTLLRALATQEVRQYPPYAIAPEGGSVDITCSTSGSLFGVYLKQRWPRPSSVIYYEDEKEPTVDEQFRGRVVFSGRQHNLTVTVHRLQPADTGAYACQAVAKDEVWGPGTLVVVTDKPPEAADTSREAPLTRFSFPVALAMGCFFIGLALGATCVLRRTQIKKLCRLKDKNPACVVYEDMSCGNRNTVSIPNVYQ
ncbi:t-cell antigen cd7 [Lynx pardinus]|uniref:T-cell antigen cd7 n=1 Tax=Lynx pardinus TaxID=191816 RepID=A0A485N409_LYNPA|nr:t-cell antigen cd7 [Lynx pardinus]